MPTIIPQARSYVYLFIHSSVIVVDQVRGGGGIGRSPAHSIVALPIFLGLTVYETKQVKELAQEAASEGDTRAASTIAIMGAVGLYLNFLNIFLILLRIMDFFGGDD